MKLAAALFFVLLSPLTLFAELKPTEHLTLKKSIQQAFKNSSELLIARKELAIARTQVSQARSQFFPKVNLNLNYIRYRNETFGVTPEDLGEVVLEAPLRNAAGARQGPLDENLYLGRLGFKQTLYAGGRLKNTYRLSQANLQRAESSYETLRRQIQYETTKAFVAVLAAQQEIKILEQGVKKFADMNKKAPASAQRWVLTKNKSDLRNELAVRRNTLRELRFDYLKAMGMELFSDVQVDGSLDLPEFDLNLESVLVWANAYRAQLRETQLQEEVDRLSVNLRSAERYPVFKFGAGYEVRDENFPLRESNWNAILSMNIPIFDGFSSIARIKESRRRAEQGHLKRVQLEDQVERDVRSAFADLRYWTGELEVRQTEQVEAKRANPSRNLSDRSELVRWRIQTQLNVIEAKVRRYIAYAQLEKAVEKPLLKN